MLTGSSGVLDVASAGTLAVGAANGEGGGVYVNYGFSLFVDSGGRVSAAEIEVEHGTIHIFGGVASITGLYEHYDTNADVEVANEGTLAILGQLHEDNSNVIRFVGSGLSPSPMPQAPSTSSIWIKPLSLLRARASFGRTAPRRTISAISS